MTTQYIKKIPNVAQKNRLSRNGKDYHITVINSIEFKDVDVSDIDLNDDINVYIFGLGINSGCYYLLCGCKEADTLRQKKVKKLYIIT